VWELEAVRTALMIRTLIVGYVFAIRSERRLCAEVQVNLAYRWFCKLTIEDNIPDHSVFCSARLERFHESEDCSICSLKQKCTTAAMRKIIRDLDEVSGWHLFRACSAIFWAETFCVHK
jgi:transposase